MRIVSASGRKSAQGFLNSNLTMLTIHAGHVAAGMEEELLGMGSSLASNEPLARVS